MLGNHELEVRALREALATLGERAALGLVLTDVRGSVMFATARAQKILSLANNHLPPELQRFVENLAKQKKEGDAARMKLAGSRHLINVRATQLAGVPRHLLLTLEEESPRRNLTKNLVEQFGLSARSIQLVQLASRGLTNREIGAQLNLSEATVKTYMHAVFRDVGVRNRAELVALAERMVKDEARDR